MDKLLLNFCENIKFMIPADWEKATLRPLEGDPNYNLEISFFKLPHIKDVLTFEEKNKLSPFRFKIRYHFKYQLCEYNLIREYLIFLIIKNRIFDFSVPWEIFDIELDQENTYVFSTWNRAVWESIESKFGDIQQAFIDFGLDKIKLKFVFNFQQYEKEERKRQLQMEKLSESLEAENNAAKANNNQMGDKKYLNNWKKNNYVVHTIDECFTSFDTQVAIEGEIFKREEFVTKSQKIVIVLSISDGSNAIKVKMMADANKLQDYSEYKKGIWISVSGDLHYDDFSKERSIFAKSILLLDNVNQQRSDNASTKRVELSVRTTMSAMDGIATASEYVQLAERLGHKAIAILDTDSLQSFPDFFKATSKSSVKPIYGASFSLIDNSSNIVINPKHVDLATSKYIVFDLETTGLSPRFNEIIEFGATIIENKKIVQQIQFFVKPTKAIPEEITKLTGITNAMVENAISQEEGIQKIYEILKQGIPVAHNAAFDVNFVNEKVDFFNLKKLDIPAIDTLNVARFLYPKQNKFRLENLAARLEIVYDSTVAHRADYDAHVLANVWINFLDKLEAQKIFNIMDLANQKTPALLAKQFPREISIIAKNKAGLKELFKLISLASTDNFYGGPRLFIDSLPQSENLLIGSSTLKSRVIDKMLFSSKQDLYNEIKYYDYIEIPPLHDFLHYFHRGWDKEAIKEAIKDLILEAKRQNKLVVAVSDARYLNKKEAKFHEIYIHSKGVGGVRHYLYKYDNPNPVYPLQYYLTTEEMLEQFNFLQDHDLIWEIVVGNTNKIADMIEDKIEVVKKDLYAPKFDDSEKKLPQLVLEKAHQMYGEQLPEIVEKRLKRELEPILKYGFDVVYWISHKLVHKSVSNGYPVGSRGSVGSSLVATLIEITEVNPLVPHYICKQCKFSEFFEDSEYSSGFDLPDKKCPRCIDVDLYKDGQSIPFETFLGFEADKVPDIDLNFTGEYQPVIHQEVRNLFGTNHTFRAGTISTNALKTVYGYIKSYQEETGKEFSNSFIEYLSLKLEGVKRTSGQHPGGIIIIPKEFDVEDFTPINYPANDINSNWKTTHFDFKTLHDNVLKLDILGHVDPTAIRMLQELTGVKSSEIPMSDPKIISLFNSTEALGISPEEIGGETTGAQGLPEFGTKFVRQILKAAKPTTFADLVSIAGLSHGTDVWLNNADKLITEKKLKLKDVICCRDDIMIYLINKKIDPRHSFDIMERVRKGNSVTPEQEKILVENGIHDWYINSMKKIKYMFPKAHATAYVIMAWRIAYYKLYHPLAYYSTYFSVRADVCDIETLLGGKDVVDRKLVDLNKREKSWNKKETLTTKEKTLIPIFSIAQEMFARGFKIENIQLNKSDAKNWIINHENNSLIPPYTAIDGLGEAQAISIMEALKDGPFLSIEDLTERTTLNSTLIKKMKELKILDQLEETNQMTLF
ncbi:PolC-type DNA polymerase III [Candidatus Mycoplasma pogonae]